MANFGVLAGLGLGIAFVAGIIANELWFAWHYFGRRDEGPRGQALRKEIDDLLAAAPEKNRPKEGAQACQQR